LDRECEGQCIKQSKEIPGFRGTKRASEEPSMVNKCKKTKGHNEL
jgi:hypothetical protein